MNFECGSVPSTDYNQDREQFMKDLSIKLTLLTDSKDSIESTSDFVCKRIASEPDFA